MLGIERVILTIRSAYFPVCTSLLLQPSTRAHNVRQLTTSSYEELRSFLNNLQHGGSPVDNSQPPRATEGIEETFIETSSSPPHTPSPPQLTNTSPHPTPTNVATASPPPPPPPPLPAAARHLPHPNRDAKLPPNYNPNPPPAPQTLSLRQPGRKPTIEPHHLAEAVWAFATMKHHNDELFIEVAKYAVRTNLMRLPPAAVSKFIWAYAEMQVYDKPFLTEMAAVCTKKAREFNASQLTNVIWAFAALQHRDPELYRQLAKTAYRQLYIFYPGALATIIGSLADMRHYNEPLFVAALQQLAKNMRQLKPRELAMVASAVAAFHPSDHDVLDSLADSAGRVAEDFDLVDWERLVAALQLAKHPKLMHLKGMRPVMETVASAAAAGAD